MLTTVSLLLKKPCFFPFIEIPKLATKMFYYMAETMAMVIVGDASSLCSFYSELIDGDSSVFIKIGICFYVFILIIICNTTMSRLGICYFFEFLRQSSYMNICESQLILELDIPFFA